MSARVITRAEWRWVAVVSALILLATTLPVLYGALATPPGYHYIGFAYNGEEANPYLSKIVQGARGDWLYSLPYNADPGEPFFLYENYLLLGHIARALVLEPVVIFHLARLAGGALMLFTLYWFIARFFADARDRRLAFGLAAFGAGLGWLALMAGYTSADLWQTQIFPFLAVFANVHFPPALAAALWVTDALVPPAGEHAARGRMAARITTGTLILALTQPYALLIAAGLGAFWLGWRVAARAPRAEWLALMGRMALAGALGAPVALYYRWLAGANASYAGWDRQNITLASPLWDYALAFGLLLPLALAGVGMALVRLRARRAPDADALLLLGWVAITITLLYLPLAQQRRFAFGLAVPVAILAVQGLKAVSRLDRDPLRFLLMTLSSLTNVLLLSLALVATSLHPVNLFFTQGEWDALMYLRTHASPQAVVLASPDMGLYIPAWAGQRVFYGHPHETLDAAARKAEVTAFFANTLSAFPAVLKRADYVFIGPRERSIGTPDIPNNWRVVFAAPGPNGVTIYSR
ncbi:MAG: hypothetical protein HZB53_15710 [Chloroflexi bacterium]|nr:hypothetical protein [Chloroflexota bacterium]